MLRWFSCKYTTTLVITSCNSWTILKSFNFSWSIGWSIRIRQSRTTISISLDIEGSIDEIEIVRKLFEITLLLLFFRWIVSILNLSFCIIDLSVEYFDSSENGIDEVSESDCAIMIFGCLFKYFHGNVSVELADACIGLS